MYYYLVLRSRPVADRRAAIGLLKETYGAKLCRYRLFRLRGVYKTMSPVSDDICLMLGVIKYR